MREVYEQAECIMISLGEPAENSSMAFNVTRELVFAQERDHDIAELINWHGYTKYFYAFRHLLKRPYWRRVWVVQEVTSAKRAQVLCGQDSME